MPESAQRATLVLERNVEDDDKDWFVVAYLIRDNGARERRTMTRRPSRDEAAKALEALWGKMLDRT